MNLAWFLFAIMSSRYMTVYLNDRKKTSISYHTISPMETKLILYFFKFIKEFWLFALTIERQIDLTSW